MSPRDQILGRIAVLQAELSELMKVVLTTTDADFTLPPSLTHVTELQKTSEEDELPPEPGEDAPASAPLDQPRVRWKYTTGTSYRIIGDSPFRNGNNFRLFNNLKSTYGAGPFSRSDLSEMIAVMRQAGDITSKQRDDMIGLIFLRHAGPMKHRIEMVTAPEANAPSGQRRTSSKAVRKAPAASKRTITRTRKSRKRSATPSRRGRAASGSDVFSLTENPFRSGINLAIVKAIGMGPFTRDELTQRIHDMFDSGAIQTARSREAVVRDFLGRTQERRVLKRG